MPPRTDWRVGLAVFAGVFLLYELTFAAIPTGNGQWLLPEFARGDRPDVFIADWPLTAAIFYWLIRALAGPGGPFTPLAVVQTANALAAASGIAAFGQTLVLLGAGPVLGVLGALLLATSFASWFYVNADTHHLALGAVLWLFYLFVRRRTSGRPYDWRFAGVLAFFNAAEGLLLRSAVLFGAGAVAAGFVGQPPRRALRAALVYVGVGVATTVALSILVGVALKGARGLDELGAWYIINVRQVWRPHEVYETTGVLVTPLKLLKGQLSALLFGVQVLSDALREPALFAHGTVVALVSLGVVGCGLLLALAAEAWWARRRVLEHGLLALVLCGAWWLAGKVVLNSWFWPGAAKYHLLTLPPLLVLLLLGPIVTRLAPDVGPRACRRQVGLVAALLVVVVAGNAWGAMLPYYRYGRQQQALAARARSEFRADDFFVSAESGLDAVLARNDEHHVNVKDVFREKSKEDGFGVVRETIATQLVLGRRVFVYNLVPGPYTLFGINHALVRRPGERFTTRDFEAFAAGLRQRYDLVPVLTYWEEAQEPIYLFGERLQTLWQVRPRS
jgi:hypothetical protein